MKKCNEEYSFSSDKLQECEMQNQSQSETIRGLERENDRLIVESKNNDKLEKELKCATDNLKTTKAQLDLLTKTNENYEQDFANCMISRL